jgi:hypothetical protein
MDFDDAWRHYSRREDVGASIYEYIPPWEAIEMIPS